MKKLSFHTQVEQDAAAVFKQFDRDLFAALAPEFPKVEIIDFDGSRVGGKVHVRFHAMGATQDWVSIITEIGQDEKGFYFVDEGHQLPFFLKHWKHLHRVDHHDDGAIIRDIIEFKTPWNIPAGLVYPHMRKQFAARGAIYQQYFAEKA